MKDGINEEIVLQCKHRVIMALPGDEFFSVIENADRDFADLVFLANQLDSVGAGELAERVADAGLFRRPLPGRLVGHLLVVLPVTSLGAYQDHAAHSDQESSSFHGSFLSTRFELIVTTLACPISQRRLLPSPTFWPQIRD